MKYILFSSFASLLCSFVLAKEIAPDTARAAAIFDNGLRHEEIMSRKHAAWDAKKAAGVFTQEYTSLDFTPCVNGIAEAVAGDANNTFRCNNIDLYHFRSHTDLGSATGQGSSSWGWTSPSGREFIAMAQADGAAFIEISSEGKMIYLGRLPHHHEAQPKIWREIRGYEHYMLIGSEAIHHNIQIFDMTKLENIDPSQPITFNTTTDITSLFRGLPIGRTHNVVVDEKNKYAVAVGAQPRNDTCRAGLIFIDLTDITNPVSPGCASEDGYVHDAQCLSYNGPDKRYQNHVVCYGYNEDTLTIYDVTDKTNTSIISRTSYEGAQYTHQGWVLDKAWQEYLLMDDEYDEYNRTGLAKDGYPITYIWDIKDLQNPKQTGYYKSKHYGIDHNQYVVDGYTYQSNYGTGFHVLDVSSIPADPTGKGVEEVGFFDVYPEDDNEPNGGTIDFEGTWSSYAMFKSGFIFVNTIERGGFVVKVQDNVLRAR